MIRIAVKRFDFPEPENDVIIELNYSWIFYAPMQHNRYDNDKYEILQ